MSWEGFTRMKVGMTTDTVLGDQHTDHDHVVRLTATTDQAVVEVYELRGVTRVRVTTGDASFDLQADGGSVLEVMLSGEQRCGWPAIMGVSGNVWRIGYAVPLSDVAVAVDQGTSKA